METSTGNYLGTEKQETSYAFRKAPIAALFEDCIQYFEQLCTIVESNPEAWESISLSITDCFSKFRDWGSTTKAPSRALDHALRKSSVLQETTRSFLEDLLNTLHISKMIEFPLSRAKHSTYHATYLSFASQASAIYWMLADHPTQKYFCLLNMRTPSN